MERVEWTASFGKRRFPVAPDNIDRYVPFWNFNWIFPGSQSGTSRHYLSKDFHRTEQQPADAGSLRCIGIGSSGFNGRSDCRCPSDRSRHCFTKRPVRFSNGHFPDNTVDNLSQPDYRCIWRLWTAIRNRAVYVFPILIYFLNISNFKGILSCPKKILRGVIFLLPAVIYCAVSLRFCVIARQRFHAFTQKKTIRWMCWLVPAM